MGIQREQMFDVHKWQFWAFVWPAGFALGWGLAQIYLHFAK